jgi:hypothetical protein
MAVLTHIEVDCQVEKVAVNDVASDKNVFDAWQLQGIAHFNVPTGCHVLAKVCQ